MPDQQLLFRKEWWEQVRPVIVSDRAEATRSYVWSVPQYSREDVNKAGRQLIEEAPDRDDYEMLDVINNWRAAHSFPLNTFQGTLRRRARKIDGAALVAQRLKRLSSIRSKLIRFSPTMKLSQMQDIGGCRAVFTSVDGVRECVRAFKASTAKNPTKRHEFVSEHDYLRSPKDDGYRSYHLVYKYRSRSTKHSAYNGLKIEIQLRSSLQHAWATAVETAAAFTNQALKTGGGNIEWRRFFALMGSAIAVREQCPMVPNTPSDYQELVDEIKALDESQGVLRMLENWNEAIDVLPTKGATNAEAFLLVMNLETRRVQITGYLRSDLDKAASEYLDAEKASDNSSTQAVLVSVESIDALRKAYPNYYLDTTVFIETVKDIIEPGLFAP